MTEKEFDELIRKAFEMIAEKEYEESQKQEIPQHKFSERHERIMKQMFKDMRNGIDIQKKYGKKIEKR